MPLAGGTLAGFVSPYRAANRNSTWQPGRLSWISTRAAIDGDATDRPRREERCRVVREVVRIAERNAVERDVVLAVLEAADGEDLRLHQAGAVRIDARDARRDLNDIAVVRGRRGAVFDVVTANGRFRFGRGERALARRLSRCGLRVVRRGATVRCRTRVLCTEPRSPEACAWATDAPAAQKVRRMSCASGFFLNCERIRSMFQRPWYRLP